jgi:2,4-dienoyl-CoA reductase (NADPH2)
VDIAALLDGFRAAALAAVAAGLDGVEVNAGQTSLLRQFLSAVTNTRSDHYGSDRARLVREVLDTVRGAVGSDVVVGVRLACDELAPWAGITPEVSVEVARDLAGPATGESTTGARLVDYVVAVRAPVFDQGGTRPDGHTDEGFAIPLARGLRGCVRSDVAIVTQGSIVDVDMAERAIADRSADVVEMTRAQIADPDLVNKVAAGEGQRVRPCVLCNQRCQVRDARNPIVSCIGEPSSGYETRERLGDEPAGTSAPPLDVLIVGSGPAGLEAARTAAHRGHVVTVVERDRRVGGHLRTASWGAGRARLGRLIDWLEGECGRLGVTVETGRTVTADDVEQHTANGGRVVLCTGSVVGAPRHGSDGTVEMVDAAGFLGLVEAGGLERLPAGPVVVDDPIGDAVGISLAELLAAEGRTVSLITGDLVAGTQLSRTGDLAPANARLALAGVRVVKRSTVVGIADGRVVVEDRYSGTKDSLDASVLVESSYRLPAADLVPDDDRSPSARRVFVAGDAVAPRTVYEAVLEGRRAIDALERVQ